MQEQQGPLLEEAGAQHRHFRHAKNKNSLLPFSFWVPLAESFLAALLSQSSWWGRGRSLSRSHTCRTIHLSMVLAYLVIVDFLRQPLGKPWL